MIYRRSLLGSLGNAGQDAYNAVINSGGSFAQAEAAARNASSTPAPVAYYAPTPVITNTPPAVVAPTVTAAPTRQTIQPVTTNADPVTPVTTPQPPAIISAKTVEPVIPNVTYSSDSGQYSLTQMTAGPGIDVPPEYQPQDVVATPEAPAVSSASLPWGLILALAGTAYESFKK